MAESNINPNEESIKEKKRKAAFFANYKRAIDQWEKDHLGKMPPVIQDKKGNWVWVNRKERRRLEKQNAKAR